MSNDVCLNAHHEIATGMDKWFKTNMLSFCQHLRVTI